MRFVYSTRVYIIFTHSTQTIANFVCLTYLGRIIWTLWTVFVSGPQLRNNNKEKINGIEELSYSNIFSIPKEFIYLSNVDEGLRFNLFVLYTRRVCCNNRVNGMQILDWYLLKKHVPNKVSNVFCKGARLSLKCLCINLYVTWCYSYKFVY